MPALFLELLLEPVGYRKRNRRMREIECFLRTGRRIGIPLALAVPFLQIVAALVTCVFIEKTMLLTLDL